MSAEKPSPKLAYQLLKQGKRDQARKVVGAVLKANPHNADAWFVASFLVEGIGERIKMLERALESNPQHAAARKELEQLKSDTSLLDALLSDEAPQEDTFEELPVAVPPASKQFAPEAPLDDPFEDIIPAPLPKGEKKLPIPELPEKWLMIGGGALVVVVILGILVAIISTARNNSLAALPTRTRTPRPTVIDLTPTLDLASTGTALRNEIERSMATMTAQSEAATSTYNSDNSFPTRVVPNVTITRPDTIFPTRAVPNATSTPSVPVVSGPIVSMPFNVIDAEYSKTLDRIIAVSTDPNQLHIYDPVGNTDTAVDLSRVPEHVSVSPDGLFAAVGHDAKISYVNLKTQQITLLDVTTDPWDIVLAGNGWIYVSPAYDQWVPLHAIQISTNTEVLTQSDFYAGSVYKLHKSGTRMYGTNDRISPQGIGRVDLGTDQPFATASLPGSSSFVACQGCGGNLSGFNTEFSSAVFRDIAGAFDPPRDFHLAQFYTICGNLWLSDDGLRIFTACGAVFRASDARGQDLAYNGTIKDMRAMASLDDSQSQRRIVALSSADSPGINMGDLPSNLLGIWDYETLTTRSVKALPDFVVNGQHFEADGRFVFVNAAGDHYYAIVEAKGSGLLNDYGVIVGDFSE